MIQTLKEIDQQKARVNHELKSIVLKMSSELVDQDLEASLPSNSQNKAHDLITVKHPETGKEISIDINRYLESLIYEERKFSDQADSIRLLMNKNIKESCTDMCYQVVRLSKEVEYLNQLVKSNVLVPSKYE
jgi:hypothetical protein